MTNLYGAGILVLDHFELQQYTFYNHRVGEC